MRSTLFLLALILTLGSQAAERSAQDKPSVVSSSKPLRHTQDKPNIVLFYIDDMGWGEIGPFGHQTNKTPHLDRMANEGLCLREFYTSNTACSPSRAAMLTGTYAGRIEMDGQVHFPGENWGLNPSEITIAEMLKEQGYATGCFGKWHLGDQPEFLPLAQGFDRYFGIPYSNDMWPGNSNNHRVTKTPYTPLPIVSQNEPVAYVSDAYDQALLAESLTNEAVKFIEANHTEPFFCYIPHAYVHNPRFARKPHYDRAEENVHRSTTEEIDDSVGRVLETVRRLELSENTLVIFTSDNGGVNTREAMGGLRGGKGGPKYEGHMREPMVVWWPGTIPAGSESHEIATTTDFFPSLARLVGGKVPTDRRIDGKDALDVLLGKPGAKSPHTVLHYEEMGVRRGKWKLVRKGRDAAVELYNLANDFDESANLAIERPDLVRELVALCEAYAKDIATDVRPRAVLNRPTLPLILEPGNYPILRTYMDIRHSEVYNALGNPVPAGQSGAPPKRANKR